MISPPFRLEDKSSLGRIGHDEAVNNVMKLTSVSTSLIDFTYELFRRVTIGGVLERFEPVLHQITQVFRLFLTKIFVAIGFFELCDIVDERTVEVDKYLN